MVLIGAGIFYGIGLYRYFTSPQYKEYQRLLELEKKYMADTYGGDTPEETLELFIDALKKGDTDLAAKYFVLDKQEEWRKNLDDLKGKDLLASMIRDLGVAEKGKDISETSARFIVANKNNEVITVINIVKSINNKWKILEL